MAKKKLTKGDTLVCVPCGAELIVSETGAAYAEQWCCGRAMEVRPPRRAAAPKPAAQRGAAGKPAAKKPAAKKAPAKKKR